MVIIVIALIDKFKNHCICRYLVMQGYKGSQITIITMYRGQMLQFRKILKAAHEAKDNKNALGNLQCFTVDDYQGTRLHIHENMV